MFRVLAALFRFQFVRSNALKINSLSAFLAASRFASLKEG